MYYFPVSNSQVSCSICLLIVISHSCTYILNKILTLETDLSFKLENVIVLRILRLCQVGLKTEIFVPKFSFSGHSFKSLMWVMCSVLCMWCQMCSYAS